MEERQFTEIEQALTDRQLMVMITLKEGPYILRDRGDRAVARNLENKGLVVVIPETPFGVPIARLSQSGIAFHEAAHRLYSDDAA